jgi:hypothetical protein
MSTGIFQRPLVDETGMITTQMGSTVNQKMAEVRGTLKLSLYVFSTQAYTVLRTMKTQQSTQVKHLIQLSKWENNVPRNSKPSSM